MRILYIYSQYDCLEKENFALNFIRLTDEITRLKENMFTDMSLDQCENMDGF